MGLTTFLGSAGLGLVFAKVGALVFILLLVLGVGGAMMNGVILGVVERRIGKMASGDGERVMVMGSWY